MSVNQLPLCFEMALVSDADNVCMRQPFLKRHLQYSIPGRDLELEMKSTFEPSSSGSRGGDDTKYCTLKRPQISHYGSPKSGLFRNVLQYQAWRRNAMKIVSYLSLEIEIAAIRLHFCRPLRQEPELLSDVVIRPTHDLGVSSVVLCIKCYVPDIVPAVMSGLMHGPTGAFAPECLVQGCCVMY